MFGPRRIPPHLQLPVAAGVVGALALWVTYSARWGSTPRGSHLIFARLFAFDDYWNAWAMLLALAAALALPALGRAAAASARWIDGHLAATCALAFVALAAGARFVYLAHPLSMDEYAPWMQAHAFARGELAAHYPPELVDRIVPWHFRGHFIRVNAQTGAAASAYWPGLALMLAPFARLELTWLLNPALSALALAPIHALATRIAGARGAGGWAVLFALASPAFTANAISFYAMPGLLALNLLFVWLLTQGGRWRAFAAGLVGSAALVMHNPVPHALVALPAVAWLAADRDRRRLLAPLLAGYAVLALPLGLGWPALTARLGMDRLAADAHGAGFVHAWLTRLGDVFALPGPGLLEARWHAAWKAWIWACPGLFVLAAAAVGRDPTARLLGIAFGATFAFYFLVPFDQGHGWGYRYIHPVWGGVPVLAGVAMAVGPDAVRRWGPAFAAAGLLATPVFLWQVHANVAEALSHLPPVPAAGNWVVFVADRPMQYSGDLVQNPPGHDRVLLLFSRDPAADRAWMAQHFPRARLALADARGSLWELPEQPLPSSP